MAPAPGHDYFSELPLEMLQHISSYLGSWDKLKLRTVFPKTKADIMVATLGELITTVYVSPTKTSLEHFQETTKSPFFAQHIRKVVYVPRAIDEDTDVPGIDKCREICPEWSVVEARKACYDFSLLVEEHKAHRSASLFKLDAPMLEILQKGLARLKGGLKVVVIAENIQSDGLNATALWYSDEYAERRDTLGLRAITVKHPVNCLFLYELYVPCQLFAIFEAIRLAKLNLRNLELGNNLCGQLEIGLEYQRRLMQYMSAAPDDLAYVLPKLRKLTVSCSDEWTTRERSSEPFWKYIACGANGIQDLTLYVDWYAFAWNFSEEDIVFERFLRHGNYPSLQKLRIQCQNTESGMLDLHLLVEFLRRHYDSLRHISFADVIISEHADPTIDDVPWYSGETVCETIRAFVEWLPAVVIELQSFEMKVHRQDKYKLYHRQWLEGHTLDTLAEEMGLTPSSANEWDFGQALKKTLKGA